MFKVISVLSLVEFDVNRLGTGMLLVLKETGV